MRYYINRFELRADVEGFSGRGGGMKEDFSRGGCVGLWEWE